MKKIIAMALFIAIISICVNSKQSIEPVLQEDVPQIFFVDRKLHRLISLDFLKTGSPDFICKKMVKEIVEGREHNEEILQIIPRETGSISVHLNKDAAYVDLSGGIASKIEKNPENERLVIYQIVNSLTSVNGVNRVLFTIDGKVQKDFLGFFDMREIFTANYDV